MESRKDISIVIPCLNEEKTIKFVIDKCFQVFRDCNLDGEVIVSDNGSCDNSINIALECGANVVHCRELGYGITLLTGFKAAQGKFIGMLDADNTYDALEFKNYINAMDENVDMVIGTRLKGYIEKGAMPFLNRYFGTPFLTFMLNLLYNTGISDTNCGMRLFRKDAFDKINFKSTGMEFATDMLIEFSKHKFKIKEIKISLYKDIKNRKPHLRPFRDGFRHLFLILRKKFTE